MQIFPRLCARHIWFLFLILFVCVFFFFYFVFVFISISIFFFASGPPAARQGCRAQVRYGFHSAGTCVNKCESVTILFIF